MTFIKLFYICYYFRYRYLSLKWKNTSTLCTFYIFHHGFKNIGLLGRYQNFTNNTIHITYVLFIFYNTNNYIQNNQVDV